MNEYREAFDTVKAKGLSDSESNRQAREWVNQCIILLEVAHDRLLAYIDMSPQDTALHESALLIQSRIDELKQERIKASNHYTEIHHKEEQT